MTTWGINKKIQGEEKLPFNIWEQDSVLSEVLCIRFISTTKYLKTQPPVMIFLGMALLNCGTVFLQVVLCQKHSFFNYSKQNERFLVEITSSVRVFFIKLFSISKQKISFVKNNPVQNRRTINVNLLHKFMPTAKFYNFDLHSTCIYIIKAGVCLSTLQCQNAI